MDIWNNTEWNVKKEPKLVVILTTGRSGSTLLSMMLNQHPRIDCPPELHLPRAANLRRITRYVRFPGGLNLVSGNIYVDLYRDYPGNRRLITKNSGKFPRTMLAVPIKYLWLYRHPKAYEKTIIKQVASPKTGSIEDSWINSNMGYYNVLVNERLPHMRIEFESFIKDQATILSKICSFIELPYDKRMTDYPDKQITAVYSGKARGSRTQGKRESIDSSQIIANKISSKKLLKAVKTMEMNYS